MPIFCAVAENPELGRDRQVLAALRSSGIPFVHIILGPGCDGESSIEAMRTAVHDMHSRGLLLGWFSLDGALSTSMARLAQSLSPNRTPNIISQALANLEDASDDSVEELFTIRRHGREQSIPAQWLTIGLAFAP